jgi:hypothetical protein
MSQFQITTGRAKRSLPCVKLRRKHAPRGSLNRTTNSATAFDHPAIC